jgi:ferredoxin
MRITVNPAVCDGFGFCAEILPEVLSLDEWGFPIVCDGEVPERLRRAGQQAVQFCPRRALTLAESSKPRPARRIMTQQP